MHSPIYRQTKEKIRFWTDTHGRRFEVLSIWRANEQVVDDDDTTGQDDMWIDYRNQTTGETYSCRLEAFTSRFTPLPD